jgi:hypothetical protein
VAFNFSPPVCIYQLQIPQSARTYNINADDDIGRYFAGGLLGEARKEELGNSHIATISLLAQNLGR